MTVKVNPGPPAVKELGLTEAIEGANAGVGVGFGTAPPPPPQPANKAIEPMLHTRTKPSRRPTRIVFSPEIAMVVAVPKMKLEMKPVRLKLYIHAIKL